MFSYMLHDEALLERVLGAVLIFVASLIVARMAALWIGRLGKHSSHRLFSLSLYSSLVQAAIVVVGLLTIFSTLGIAIAPVLTTLGLGGLAVALALNDTLSNLFAGIQIITAHQLHVGDYVHFDFAEGEIADIQWHNTTIRDLAGNLVVVPNAKVNTSVFTNFSRTHQLTLPVTASLPWKGTFAQLNELAQEAAGGARVRITAVNETNVQITAYLPAKSYADRSARASEFLERLHDAAVGKKMGAPKDAPDAQT